MTTKPSAVASSIGLTGKVGTMNRLPRSLVRCVFADRVADVNRAAADDSSVTAAEMKGCTLLVIGKVFRIGAVASGEFRAAGVFQVADLDDDVWSDAELAASGQVGFAEVQVDDQVVAREAHVVLVAGNLAQKSFVHERDL